MKILLHTVEYYPTSVAAAYRMKVFAEVFSNLGHDVTVITEKKKHVDGIPIFQERIIYAPTVPMKNKSTFWRLLNNASYGITSFLCALRTGGCDVVITTTPPALISISGWLIARLKGAKLVYDVKDIWPDIAIEMNSFSENGLYSAVFRWITRFMCKHADLITTVSKRKVTKLSERYLDGSDRKIVLVENGFNVHDLECAMDPCVIEQYSLDERFTCVYVGNIGIAQGLESLLEVARRTKHKNIQFLIFGDGAERTELQRRAAEEGLSQVNFLGPIGHEKVVTILRKAQINFIPLLSEKMTDTIPTKLYEALGLGCPVFLVAEGDACDLLDETGLGIHVPPSDQSGIVKAFDNMVENYASVLEKCGEAQKRIGEKHTRQKFALRLEAQLQELLYGSVKVGE